jgi:hypothetical protein
MLVIMAEYCYAECRLCCVKIKPIMLSVVMLSVVTLSVVAPLSPSYQHLTFCGCHDTQHDDNQLNDTQHNGLNFDTA